MATYNFDSTTVQTREGQRSLLSRTFLYMLGLVAITALVSVAMHFIFRAAGVPGIGETGFSIEAQRTYITVLSTASVMQVVLTIVMMFTSIRSGKITIPAILYAVCMGVLISSFSFVLSWYTITIAFAIAACCFGAMALFGYLSKNASGLGMVGCGLIFGILMVSLFNIIMVLVAPKVWAVQNIITSVLIVIAIMCITGYDVWQIKEISQRGLDTGNGNLAFYLAFNLYLDFIVIFLHIIRLIAMFASERN